MAKVKIPKRIAGVKVPKHIRKTAKKALKRAQQPVVGPVAGKLARAAAGAATRAARNRAERAVKIEAERIGEAFRTAATDGLRRFLDGLEEGLTKVHRLALETKRPEGS
jgi:hypothetical protein